MVYDITLIYQQTVCFFMSDLASWFRSKLQSVAVMASSMKCLLDDEVEQSLLEELTPSDQSSSSGDDSSGTDDLTVGEVIVSEYSYDESDDVESATATSAPSVQCYIYVGGHDKLCRAMGNFF
jgi:hypothetical protein